MIENANASKTTSSVNVDIKKFIGVASLNVVAVNPNNAILKRFGWNIPDGAEEPVYTFTQERNGKLVKGCRVRFLCQIMDFDTKPVVALDFWARENYKSNKEGTKFEVIDQFTRTAWASKEDIENRRIPVYNTDHGSFTANLALPYKVSHEGESELVAFVFKYLNITPFQVFDRKANAYVNAKNPGKLTIDNWDAICKGDVSEIKSYLNMQPENRVKVVLGIRTSEDNKSYQTFLNTNYFGNGSSVDSATGEYPGARKAIDKYNSSNPRVQCEFSALPVKEWTETPTKVEDHSEDMPDDMPAFSNEFPNDLPFDLN